MDERKRIVRIAGRLVAISVGAIIFAAALPYGGLAATQKAAKPSTSEEASPKQIQELMTLLADPKVRNWLEKESKAEAASEQAAAEESVSQELDGRLAANRTTGDEGASACGRGGAAARGLRIDADTGV
jgi:hypothetical protein